LNFTTFFFFGAFFFFESVKGKKAKKLYGLNPYI